MGSAVAPVWSPDNPFLGAGSASPTATFSDDNPFAPKPIAPLRPLNIPSAPRDVTAVGAAPNPQATDLTKGNVLERTGAALTSAVEHPLRTAAGIVTAPLQAAKVGAQKIGQTAAEMSLPPDIAQRAFEDPDRISDKDALIAAAQLATIPVGGAVARGVTNPIARALAIPAVSAATGAAYMPEDPAVGALIGTAAGVAAHAIPKLNVPRETPVDATIPAPKPLEVPSSMPAEQQGPLRSRAAIEASEAAGLAPAGVEERAAGLSVPKQVRDAVSTAVSQATTNPYAPIAAEHPELSNALQSAGAMTGSKAEAFGRQLAQRVVKGLTPEQAEQFETARVATNLEAEADRKSAGAKATADQAVNHRMEVRRLAQQDLDAEKAKADQVMQQGQQEAAAYDAANRPPEAPSDLDMAPSERASRQKAIADHAARVQEILDGAKASADEIVKPAQQDYDLAVKKGDEGHDALQKEAFAKQKAAERATAEAATLRAKVPNGVAAQPWFQEALKKHNQIVEPFGEAAAVRTGVDPAALRRTPLGYARLSPQEVINERLIQRTQETAAEHGEGSTVPRKGIKLKILGQKPSVNPLLPAGATEPLQGPVNTMKPEPSSVASPTAATLETGSAKEFRGAEGYSTDYVTNVARDLSDKVPKMAKNQVFQALASDAMKTGSKIRKLLPEENPAPGEKLIAFNDAKDIINPPAKTDPNYQQVQRFAVPSDVADAFQRYQSRGEPTSKLGKGMKAVNQGVMRAILQMPGSSQLIMAGHSLTEASNVSRSLPADAGVVKTVATGLPLIKSAHAFTRAMKLDIESPAKMADLQRLALSGALRIGDERGEGWIDASHHALFGPNGVDTRMRLIASEDAQADWKKMGGSLNDPAFIAFERDRVTGHSGQYNTKNQGTMIAGVNKADLAPFIAITRAKVGTSFPAAIGSGGPPGEGIGGRILRAQRGPIGQAGQLIAAGYLLSGHGPTQNAPGHETDIATGVYHLKDGSHKYFRGSPDEAKAFFGADQDPKEVYVRQGFVDPSSKIVSSILAPIAFAKPGDKVSESLRAASNAVLGAIGPTTRGGFQVTTGRDLYFDKDGALGSIQGIHLAKDADLTDRLISAARNINSGAAIGMASPTGGGRSALNAVVGNLNPFTEGTAGSAPRIAMDRKQVKKVLDDGVNSLYAEKDPAAKQVIIQKIQKQFEDAGIQGDRQVALGMRDLFRASAKSQGPRKLQQPLTPQYSPNNPFKP
jgi:hypothetical protein